MNRSTNTKDPLAQRLVQEAQSNRPEFSAALQEKICQDVRRVGLASESVIFTIRPWWQRPAVAAAMLALIGWGGYRFAAHQQTTAEPTHMAGPAVPAPMGRPVPSPDTVPPQDDVSAQVSDEALGQEVAVVAETLLDQMPVNLLNVVGDLAQTQ